VLTAQLQDICSVDASYAGVKISVTEFAVEVVVIEITPLAETLKLATYLPKRDGSAKPVPELVTDSLDAMLLLINSFSI
jgi:hypothetical protein